MHRDPTDPGPTFGLRHDDGQLFVYLLSPGQFAKPDPNHETVAGPALVVALSNNPEATSFDVFTYELDEAAAWRVILGYATAPGTMFWFREESDEYKAARQNFALETCRILAAALDLHSNFKTPEAAN